MPLEPFATVDDLQKRWRDLEVDEIPRAAVLLIDASNIIRSESGSSYNDPDELVSDVLEAVTCEMVKRAMLSPIDRPAVNSWQQGAGPYNESLSFTNPSGDLYLLASERKRLGIGTQKAFTIQAAIHDCSGGVVNGG